jgi:hypothetical protein
MIDRVGVLRLSGGVRAVTIWVAGVDRRERGGFLARCYLKPSALLPETEIQ